MAHRKHGNAFDDAMELLIENGFDGMADVLKILLNEAMKIEREDCLAARAYQRTPDRKGYANGFKPKTVDTRMGRITSIVRSGITHAEYQYVGSRVAERTYPYMDVTYKPTYDNLGRVTRARTHEDGNDIVVFDYDYASLANNISKITFDHRNNDPCTDFTYDNLDRLTLAEYGINDNNQVFTIYDLGNGTTVNEKDSSNVAYSVDNVTNRYNSVGGVSLTYDNAGNLTKDKDAYEYSFDYENRVVKVIKGGVDIAAYAYDALGRRVRKTDYIADTNNMYYYNDKWQVLSDYNDSDVVQSRFIWGNYIDEALVVFEPDSDSWYFYAHDHLYSPAALLLGVNANVMERYEYDAYGNVSIMEPNYASRSTSLYGNPYYFTGRRMDELDSANLKRYHYRNRDYDDYTGRFLQHDPLGITPNPQKPNRFGIRTQYRDGLNIYEYVKDNPVMNIDPFGLTMAPLRYEKDTRVCCKLRYPSGSCGQSTIANSEDCPPRLACCNAYGKYKNYSVDAAIPGKCCWCTVYLKVLFGGIPHVWVIVKYDKNNDGEDDSFIASISYEDSDVYIDRQLGPDLRDYGHTLVKCSVSCDKARSWSNILEGTASNYWDPGGFLCAGFSARLQIAMCGGCPF